MKRPVLRALVRAERTVEAVLGRLRPARGKRPAIEVYLGYATPEHWVARGRILSRLIRPTAREGQGAGRNLLQMLALFLTDEVAEVTVAAPAHGLTAVTDEEGYFTLLVPREPEPAAGWAEVAVEAEGARALLPVQVPAKDARFAVISDIDDTVLRTGAWNLWRNLWTTFTGNMATRTVFPDAVALVARLSEGGRNPVFFVSSSPWNMHAFLEGVFARAGLARGPLFLRDLGIGEVEGLGAGQDGGQDGGHGAHKGSVIDRLLAANPGLSFWLVGDTGQHDAAIYAAVVARHPGRVGRVVLRRAGRDADPGSVAALRAAGIPVDFLTDYRPLIEELGPG